MASGGWFSKEVLPEGWFDETLKPEGWFSADLIEAAASGGVNITGASTIGFVSQSSSVKLPIAITGASTIGAVSAASVVSVPISLTVASTIGVLTQTSSVTLSEISVNITGTNVIGDIASSGFLTLEGVFIPSRYGDDGYRRKRPIIHYTGKVERKLDRALEIVENIEPEARTSVKRAAVKQAREVLAEVQDYSPAIQAINSALAKVSRLAGGVESFRQSVLSVEEDIERELAEINRKRRRMEEEVLVAWLFN